jgi:hypothetical protein
MQAQRKTLSWIVSTTAAVFFMSAVIIYAPHGSLSQEYSLDNREPMNSYYTYESGLSIFSASSNGDDDDEDDDGGDEQDLGAGDTTEICNRYLETCDEGGASTTQGNTSLACNKLFESCPTTPTPTQSPTISPSPAPTPKPTPTPTPLPTQTPSATTETPVASLTNTTAASRLSSSPDSLSCPPVGNSPKADSSNNATTTSGGNYSFLRKLTVEFNPAGLGLDDSSDNAYVSDYSNNRIQKLSSNGTVITTWGGESQFNNPEGISVDPCTREVLVADTDNHRIQKFNSNGTFITRWGSQGSADGQFNHPYGVAADRSGNVFVSDFDNHRIQKFNSNGTFITTWGSQGSADGLLNKPDGISIDKDSQDVYISDGGNSRIQVFSNTVK